MSAPETETIQLPVTLVQRLRDAARLSGRSIDELLTTALNATLPQTDGLPTDQAEALLAMMRLDDAQLWVIARSTMDDVQTAELSGLLARNSEGEHDETDLQRLESLVDMGELMTLRRSCAYLLLARRGHRVPTMS